MTELIVVPVFGQTLLFLVSWSNEQPFVWLGCTGFFCRADIDCCCFLILENKSFCRDTGNHDLDFW